MSEVVNQYSYRRPIITVEYTDDRQFVLLTVGSTKLPPIDRALARSTASHILQTSDESELMTLDEEGVS